MRMPRFKDSRFYKALALATFLCSPIPQVLADDTDIYLNKNVAGAAPYLMLKLDYRPDMSATFCGSGTGNGSCTASLSAHAELLASLQSFTGVNGAANNIHATLAVLNVVFNKFEGINVGLMVPNNSDGGTILRGYKLFEAGDANGAKAELIAILDSMPLPKSGNQFHNTAPKETHYEWYSYVNGLAVLNGDQTSDNFDGTASPNYDPNIIDNSIPGKPMYKSPFAGTPSNFECTNLYEVYATSGNTSGADNDLDTQIGAVMNGASSYEEMVSYMTNNDVLPFIPGDQTLKTWYIQMGSSAAKADNWAIAADTNDQYMNIGGKSADLFDVQTKLESAFVEALSVSTTFVAASIPVNVFNRIQILDDFYIALFEANATARWNGNLKKLRLHDSDLDGIPDQIVDALGQEAFNSTDGRIKYEALTYWTDANALPPADPADNEVSERDGRAVNRGGAGQMIPGFLSGSIGDTTTTGTRQLYLEPTSGSALEAFDASNANASSWQAELGAASTAEALEVIKWARGQDADDEDGDSDKSEARSWLLGDAIHSRPLTINYGATAGYTEANPNIRLFMGTNDGFFHVFENTTSGGTQSGKEVFGFIPREVMANFKTLKDNVTSDHLYGVDGEPVALVKDLDADGTIETGDTVNVYVGMRRGGKSIYAMDASDPTAAPSYIGKLSNTMSDYAEMGYTFSTPRVSKVRFGGITYDTLIFAGGYDTNKDATATDEDGSRGADTEGNAIFIVNALDGTLIWKAVYGASTAAINNGRYEHASLQYSIPSTATTLDSNRNGIVDRVYVGDTGGQVWRVDLPEGDSADTNHRLNHWDISVLADLSDAADSEDVRFFHAPDVIQTKDDNGFYDAVVIASGDRANPLESTDQNYMYMIKDRYIASGSPSATTTDDTNLTDVTSCATTCAAFTYDYGWKMELSQSGEKGLSSPLVSNGTVFFTSYTPYSAAGSSCAPREGNGNLYLMNLSDGSASFTNSRQIDIGPGIPASPIALNGDTILLPGTGLQTIPTNTNFSGSDNLIQVGGRSMWLLYWRETGVDTL